MGGILIITLTGFGLSAVPSQYENKPEIALPILVLVGAVGLLFALAFIAIAFDALNLTNRSQALALPEGSVRALIALLLITIFAITGIFLYRQISIPAIYTSTGLTLAEKDILLKSIPKEDILSIQEKKDEKSNTVSYTFVRRIAANKESKDFAGQLLTTIGTLVVAVAGFYFGNRSVAAARKAMEISSPVIRSIDPAEGNQGSEHEIEIFGENFHLPKIVKLVHGTKKEMVCESILSGPTRIKAKLTIAEKAPDKKWDLVVVNDDGGEARLAEAFEVKKKTQTP